MICKPCKTGADIKTKDPLALEAKKDWHKKCTGCDCQHRVEKKVIV